MPSALSALRATHVAAVPGWTALANPPNAFLDNCNLLTDGRVMCHVSETNRWRVLKPDDFGSYVNGSWSFSADMPPGNDASFGCVNCTYAPKYFDNALLADGRLVVIGGEYNGSSSTNIWTNIGFMYDPSVNMWSSQLSESLAGGNNFGDAASVVLADGRMIVGPPRGGTGVTRNLEAFNPATLAFTALNPTGKGAGNSEETWNILPDGRVFTVNANRASQFEIYDPVLNDWGSDGPTPVLLADFNTNPDSREIGPAVLRADGQLAYFSGTSIGQNALYDVNTGTWSHPVTMDFPLVPAQTFHYAVADGPASLMPNGDIVVQASPVTNVACGNMVPPPPPTCGVFNTPSHFYQLDFDTNVLTQVADTPNAGSFNAYEGRMILLPTGEVLLTAYDQNNTSDVMIYSNGEPFKEAWRPVITVGPGPVTAGNTYTIKGLLFNGFSEGASYGDDAQASTNYPLVRLTNLITGHVKYARTHDHSRMGVQAVGSLEEVTTRFDAPLDLEPGPNALEVVVNGIPSLPIILGPVDLAIEKTATPHPIVFAGQELVYKIKVTNKSESAAGGVYVRDTLPDGVVYIDNTNPFGCDATNLPELICGIGSIEAGGMRMFEIKTRVPVDAVVAESDGTITLTNTATVEPVDLDIEVRDNTAILKTFVEDSADLKVIKLSKPDTAVNAGQLFTYTIYVDNLGPSSARGVYFTDDMIASGAFTILSTTTDPLRDDVCSVGPATPPQSGQVTRCTLQEPLEPAGSDPDGDGIPNSGRWRIQVVARANQTQDIDNVVQVSTGPGSWPARAVTWTGGTPDPNGANNVAIDAISIIDTADVTLTKTGDGEEQVSNQPGLIFNNAVFGQAFPAAPNYATATRVTAGRRIRYVLTVGNTGPSRADNVVVRDRLPGGVRLYQGSLTVVKDPAGAPPPTPLPAGTCNTGTPGDPIDKLTCPLGALNVGDTATITFEGITDAGLTPGAVVENDASVASDVFDPNNANNLRFVQNTVLAAADMAIAKSAVGEVVSSYDTTLRRFVDTDTANQVTAGKQLRYQLQVQNNGPSNGQNVTIQENLPAAPVPGPVTFVRATGADCRPDDINQQLLFCQLGDMAAGERRTIDLYVAVDESVPATTVLNNTATVLQSGSNVVPPGPPPAIPGVDPMRPITWDPCLGCNGNTNPNVATNASTVGAVADVFVRYAPLQPLAPQP
ncbi:MAG: hypothetical protein ABI780_12970, partial [Ardenticatenales bacterium]